MSDTIDGLRVSDEVKKDAIQRFETKMKEWGIAMPPAKPLVMDFGLGEFNKVGLIEYWIANEVDAGYCGKYLFLFDGQQCPFHSHHDKHETFFVVKGKIRMIVNGDERLMTEGDVLAMPTNTVHSFFAVEGDALVLEISNPCIIADNVFEDPKIAAWLTSSNQEYT